ncbi:MAG TPA: alanine racemase [Armatimonadota bacterium]|nr:alanine racemase [Armatimonadota bacterium]
MRPAWVEVDVSAIRDNVAAINDFVGPATEVLAVVKADAYGHGLIPAAQAALAGGATILGVAIPEEVARLREAGITAPTLIIGCSFPQQAEEVILHGASAVVSYLDAVHALADAAIAHGTHARVHVKVNTGMGRVGVRWNEAVDFIRQVATVQGIELEGIMTHFATADYEDQTSVRTQLERFTAVVEGAAAHGIHPRYCHCASSAAITFLKESHFNLVRPGLIIYGLPPVPMASDVPPETGYPAIHPPTKRVDYARERTEETRDRYVPFQLRPALSLKARVVQINRLPAGDAVGYGLTYRSRRDSVFALLPLGYADGLSRALSNRGWVIIHGQRAPIAGRVSMDQTIIDVTDIPDVAIGDTAVLIGRQGDEYISAWEVGLGMGSIAYEALTNLGVRLPRVYGLHETELAK